MHLIENVKYDKFIPYFKRLIHHPSGEIKVHILRIIRQYVEEDLVFEASELIEDENQEVQIEAMRYLSQHSINKIDTLKKFLSHQNDLLLRYNMIKALNKLKSKFPLLKFDEQYIESKIFDETKNYYRILLILNNQNTFMANIRCSVALIENADRLERAKQLLIKALEEKLDNNLERIFRLLGLKYEPNDMFNAYKGITNKKKDLIANAIEFLDNVLDSNLKKFIIPIVETQALGYLIDEKTNQHLRETQS